MCDPLTIIGAVGTGFSALSASSSSGTDAKIADMNAEIGGKLAKVQELGATTASQKAAFDEARVRDQVAKVLGQAKTYYASRNLDPTFGSPLLVQGLTAAQGEVDAGLIRAEGANNRASALAAAASTEAGAASSAWQAVSAQQQSQNDILAGVFGAGTALLKGGATAWPGMSLGSSSVGGVIPWSQDTFDTSSAFRIS